MTINHWWTQLGIFLTATFTLFWYSEDGPFPSSANRTQNMFWLPWMFSCVHVLRSDECSLHSNFSVLLCKLVWVLHFHYCICIHWKISEMSGGQNNIIPNISMNINEILSRSIFHKYWFLDLAGTWIFIKNVLSLFISNLRSINTFL